LDEFHVLSFRLLQGRKGYRFGSRK